MIEYCVQGSVAFAPTLHLEQPLPEFSTREQVKSRVRPADDEV